MLQKNKEWGIKKFIDFLIGLFIFKRESINEAITSKNFTYSAFVIIFGIGLFDAFLSFIVFSRQHFVKIFNYGRFEEIQNVLTNVSTIDFLIAFIVIVFIFEVILPLGVSITSVWIAQFLKKDVTYYGMINLASLVSLIQISTISISYLQEYSDPLSLQLLSLILGLWIFFTFIMFYKIVTGFSFLKSSIILFISLVITVLFFAIVEEIILLLFKLFFSLA